MRFLKLPPLEYLHECFSLAPSHLVWKVRPKHHFASNGAMNSWNSKYPGTLVANINNDGYVRVGLIGKRFLVHRIIFFMETGVDPGLNEIDHKDTRRDFNSPSNLRIASHSQNQQNASVRRDNLSGVKGVSWYSKTSSWVAQIWHDGTRHSAYFKDIESAKIWINERRNKFHGDYARGEEF